LRGIVCDLLVVVVFFFSKRDGFLLEEAQLAKIRHIPCAIVHGRYDCVCPIETAYLLAKGLLVCLLFSLLFFKLCLKDCQTPTSSFVLLLAIPCPNLKSAKRWLQPRKSFPRSNSHIQA
jgi:hypothetical protein